MLDTGKDMIHRRLTGQLLNGSPSVLELEQKLASEHLVAVG